MKKDRNVQVKSKANRRSKSGVSKKKKTPASTSPSIDNLGDLPWSYGMDVIFLIAQEPRWIFTYWDIDIARHPGGKTFLHVYRGESEIESEIEVPFETRNWHIPVSKAGADYTVEIGYYRGKTWNVLARSSSVRTPRDKMSDSGEFNYATIPLHMSFQKTMESFQKVACFGETLNQTLARVQGDGNLLAFSEIHPPLSAEECVVLEAVLGKKLLEKLSNGAMSSDELSSHVQAHLGGSSEWLAGMPWSAAVTSWGSSENVNSFAFAQREFFMHMNAEVIFYGGTHPQATLTIDGKTVKLNADGTFRHHFIFPDGKYEIPIVATSPDGVETRSAMLAFERASMRSGGIGQTSQPPLAAPMGAKF